MSFEKLKNMGEMAKLAMAFTSGQLSLETIAPMILPITCDLSYEKLKLPPAINNKIPFATNSHFHMQIRLIEIQGKKYLALLFEELKHEHEQAKLP